MNVSRRKFAEALKVLKAACKNESLPWVQRIRAAELIMLIYGALDTPDTKRDKRAVKELVAERAFERQANEQVKQAVTQRVLSQAEKEAEKVFLAAAAERVRKQMEEHSNQENNDKQ